MTNRELGVQCLIHKELWVGMQCVMLAFPDHAHFSFEELSNSYTMGCPPLRRDNPRALASGLSYVQVDKYGITILYHQYQCRPCTSRDISC